MRKNRKGFTLIELVIVIAILGILALYAVPKYQELIEEARSSEARAQLGTVRSAMGIYYAKNHGVYPATLNAGLFAEDAVPEVEVTLSDGTVNRSSAVAVSPTTDGTIASTEIGDAGGWMYEVTPTSDKADVRINSKGTDTVPEPDKYWYEY